MPKLVDRATYSRGPARRALDEQVATWQAFVRAFNAATRVGTASLAASDLDASDYDVLVTLVQAPEDGLRPGELVRRVLLTKSGITRLIDRLEERGLVARCAHSSDKRGQLITLTPRGRTVLRRATPGVLRGIRTVLAPLSSADRATLTRLSERIEEAATAHSTV